MANSLASSGDGFQSMGENADDRGMKRVCFRDDVMFKDKLVRFPKSDPQDVRMRVDEDMINGKAGHVIRVDECTLMANRGKYARVAIEMDIAKPLEQQILLFSRVCKEWIHVQKLAIYVRVELRVSGNMADRIIMRLGFCALIEWNALVSRVVLASLDHTMVSIEVV
ncbi:hypothetical protein GH714_021441 [Hevea brasiliensis]|uniref:Uncharacterized protein n=1 Tax=Hevea brasiliensis TaxID=3981 RepID=A0A6A6KWF8_HEVBR|nr:hypothetical protein GH714_021441 [Hevea brasiliensis]